MIIILLQTVTSLSVLNSSTILLEAGVVESSISKKICRIEALVAAETLKLNEFLQIDFSVTIVTNNKVNILKDNTAKDLSNCYKSLHPP